MSKHLSICLFSVCIPSLALHRINFWEFKNKIKLRKIILHSSFYQKCILQRFSPCTVGLSFHSPRKCLCTSIKKQMSICAWTCFWTSYSVALSYLCILMPVFHHLEKSQNQCLSSESVLLSQICCVFIGTLEWVCQFLQKKPD